MSCSNLKDKCILNIFSIAVNFMTLVVPELFILLEEFQLLLELSCLDLGLGDLVRMARFVA